jgi:hypothetical protein
MGAQQLEDIVNILRTNLHVCLNILGLGANDVSRGMTVNHCINKLCEKRLFTYYETAIIENFK